MKPSTDKQVNVFAHNKNLVEKIRNGKFRTFLHYFLLLTLLVLHIFQFLLCVMYHVLISLELRLEIKIWLLVLDCRKLLHLFKRIIKN